MLPSAPARCSLVKVTPVFLFTISATKKNDISFPAPGPFGNITVIGFVGCHANATSGINANNAKSYFINPPRINMM